MKHFVKIAACLAGALALNASARADDIALTGNPYAQVVARNIFGLNPPMAVDPNAATIEPPVKITPNGIMSIFGQVQVLFKAAGTTPGKENSYMLAEGQRQDDIEVVKIDEQDDIVTFNNHGVQQILPLSAATTAPAPANSSIPAPMMNGANPGLRRPFGRNFGGSGFNNAFGNRGVNNPGTDNGSNLPTVPARNVSDASSQIPPGMTPEIQTIAIEANRVATQAQVDSGELPPLPVTEITPPDATGPGGAPLVTPSPDAPPQ